MYIHCIDSTLILYRCVCPPVVKSHTIQDEAVNPLTLRKYNVWNGNFVFNLCDIFQECIPGIKQDLRVLQSSRLYFVSIAIMGHMLFTVVSISTVRNLLIQLVNSHYQKHLLWCNILSLSMYKKTTTQKRNKWKQAPIRLHWQSLLVKKREKIKKFQSDTFKAPAAANTPWNTIRNGSLKYILEKCNQFILSKLPLTMLLRICI